MSRAMPATGPDAVSAAERDQRFQAFTALAPVKLRMIEPANVGMALEAMALPAEGKQALLADLQAAPTGQAAPPDPAAARPPPLRLAWITLWDTDAEDGNVVRIDSQGYTRTVIWTKRGTTFAVPIPLDGIITVTGIKDGEGGGITVGLASGAAKAIFPIMSTGQSLGLTVAIN